MTALYIIISVLLVVAFLVVLLLSCKLSFIAEYEDSLSLVMKILFWKITLVPYKKKKRKKRKRKKRVTKGKTDKDKKKEKKQSVLKKYTEKHGVDGLVSIITELATLVGTTLKGLFEHIVIEKFDIDITVCGEDAADTALKYGKTCSVFYSAVAVVLGTAKCDDYSLNLTPDFDEEHESKVVGQAQFYIRIYYVVLYFLKALLRFLKIRYRK